MASMNGVSTAPLDPGSSEPSIALSAKRKRDSSNETEQHATSQDGQNGITIKYSEGDTIRDLMDVLKSEDTTPSVLSRSISNVTSSTEPEAKRQKGDDKSGSKTTILTRYTSNAYKTVDEILRDIDVAVADIRSMLQSRADTTRSQYLPESEISLKVAAFKERAHKLVFWERAATTKEHIGKENGQVINGQKPNGSDNQKIVLTVYGNAPGPKQLFSSFQKPTFLNGEGSKIIQPLREAALPAGVGITKVIPAQPSSILVAEKRKRQTLGELFPAPASLPVAQPPKPSKVATTRSNVVGWYQPSYKDSSPRAPGYLTQNIVAGQWLDYAKSTTPQDAKKRSRDRAMSLSASKPALADTENAETEAAKLDALFRSAYSGFAPTKDESAAVVPEGHTNRIWWQRSGERTYERLVRNSEFILEAADVSAEIHPALEELDLNRLQELVDQEEATLDPSLRSGEDSTLKAAQDKEVEEVLADISELLETLNSYQRIRHMSLNSSARGGGILSTSDTSAVGTPSKPSESEQATYETLKAALKLMVETLPPYAVAKLDPDRLSELRISTKIEVEQEDSKGLLEEDEASARARAAAAAASPASRATSSTPLHRTGSSNQLYGNQYSAQQNANSQYYRPSQSAVRQPSHSGQRQPVPNSTPYQQRPVPAASPAYRPSYGTPSYPPTQQGVRATPMQYGGATQQYHQPAASQPYMRPQNQSQQHYAQSPQPAPQNALNSGYPRSPFPQQGQPAQNGLNYQYNPGNHLRQQSPHKLYSPQQAPVQPRPYGTPTPTPSQGPTRAPYLQNTGSQPHVNGSQPQAPQPAFQRTSTGPMNYSTYMTSAEQNSLLERQKAQLAQQQGLQQQQARSAAQVGLGSPSKGGSNGTFPMATGQS